MPDEKDPNEATSFAETLHRHDPDPSQWEEAQAVTGRPVDKAGPNSTLAERAQANKAKPAEKAVAQEDTENKAVQSAPTKARRAAKKSK